MNPPASQTMAADKFEVRILRQDYPDDPSYWQTFRLDRDRRRLFRALEKLHAWIPVDGYYDVGQPGPRQTQDDQQRAYPLSKCMSCGCCLEACLIH